MREIMREIMRENYFVRVRFWIFANFEGIERIFGARYEWGSIKNQNMKVNK
jgi:hypothetical protein